MFRLAVCLLLLGSCLSAPQGGPAVTTSAPDVVATTTVFTPTAAQVSETTTAGPILVVEVSTEIVEEAASATTQSAATATTQSAVTAITEAVEENEIDVDGEEEKEVSTEQVRTFEQFSALGEEDNELVLSTTIASVQAVPVTTAAPLPPKPTPTQRLSSVQRQALVGHLTNLNLNGVDKLVLTPRQRLAVQQELEHRQLGVAPFTDPTPWERLSRDEQAKFNEKFRSLSPELQRFSANQFNALADEVLEHAFGMFITLDPDTLSQVISRELEQERTAEAERQRQEQERQRQIQAQREAERARQQQLEEQRRQQEQQQRFQAQQQQRFPQQQNSFQQQPAFQQTQQSAFQQQPAFQQTQQQSFQQPQQQSFQQPQQERPRSQSRFVPRQNNFQQPQQQARQQPSRPDPRLQAQFDPRRRQPVAQQQPQQQQQQFFQQQQQQQFAPRQQQQQQQQFAQQFQQQQPQQQQQQRQPQFPSESELRHLEAQQRLLDDAVRLQNSLAFPAQA